MANTFQSGTIYIDADGSLTTKPCKVAYILFTPNSNGDAIRLYDHASTTSNQKMIIKGATGTNSTLYDFSAKPITFTNGIYVDLDANCTATLVLTSEGASL